VLSEGWTFGGIAANLTAMMSDKIIHHHKNLLYRTRDWSINGR
jgi:hypothetical protein